VNPDNNTNVCSIGVFTVGGGGENGKIWLGEKYVSGGLSDPKLQAIIDYEKIYVK